MAKKHLDAFIAQYGGDVNSVPPEMQGKMMDMADLPEDAPVQSAPATPLYNAIKSGGLSKPQQQPSAPPPPGSPGVGGGSLLGATRAPAAVDTPPPAEKEWWKAPSQGPTPQFRPNVPNLGPQTGNREIDPNVFGGAFKK